MATDIVQSLFGVTPEAYQRQQDALAEARALKFAELDPMAQATYGIYRGAGQLGGALGRALGGEDPELARISLRQQVARDIDYTNPESVQAGIQRLAPLDPQGAMMLNQEYRKALESGALVGQREASAAASLAQANRERTQAIPADILKAREIARLKQQRDLLATTGGEEQQIAYLDAQLAELRGLKEVNGSLVDAAGNVVYQGQPKTSSFGTEAERVARELYGKPFSDLTQAQMAAVNKRVEETQPKTTITNVLPGQQKLVDIPEFRAKVQRTIEPQAKAVFAADNALTAIEDSLKTNNFVSFNAARVQLAKALGDSQLSRRDVEQAGGDPSLLGGFIDVTSKLFTGTPSVDTQNKIKQTLNAIRTVSANKATQEIGRQRAIALRSPGYSAEAVNAALDFPEFAPRPAGGAPAAGGDLAAQAAAELERRRQGAK
jgi:hypothetical protein